MTFQSLLSSSSSFGSSSFTCKRPNHNSNLNSAYHSRPIGFGHHNSCDELSSTTKSNRNFYYHQPTAAATKVNFADPPQHQQSQPQADYHWPKVIPKSPSSFSMNSFRINRQPLPPSLFSSNNKSNSNYNPIESFDLDRIESECRKSHTSLFDESQLLTSCDDDYVSEQLNSARSAKTDFGTAV